MPIYEFKCSECADVYEVLVPRVSDDSVPCPSCGSAETEKLLSVTSGIISQGNHFAGCPMPCAASKGAVQSAGMVPGCPMSAGRGKAGSFDGMGGGCPMPPIG